MKILSAKKLKLYGSLRYLFGDIDTSTLSKRIESQKRAYFIREFGVSIPYYFSWYVHGPYSTDLARDLFAFEEFKPTIPEPRVYRDSILKDNLQSIEKAREFFDEIKSPPLPSRTDKHYWIELLAGLHYLYTHCGEKKITKEKVFNKIKSYKPQYAVGDKETAWKLLNKHGLVS